MVKYQPWTERYSLIGRLNTNTCLHFPPTNLPPAPVGNEDFYLESATTFRAVKRLCCLQQVFGTCMSQEVLVKG